MNEWKPREHDHVVEPVFAGLGAKNDDASVPRDDARADRRLLIAAVIAGALIASRMLVLVGNP